MSNLNELINNMCPNGVDYVSFGSLMKRERKKGKDDKKVKQVYVVSNTRGMVKAEDYRENTIHSEDTSNYTIVRKDMVAYNPARLNIGSIAMLKSDEPGLVSPMYVVFSIDQKRVTKEYFELLMKSSFLSSKIDSLKEEGARFRFDYSRWDWIKIPLPPLSVQTEIVRLLEGFSKLIITLEKEADARELQYQYYIKKLLEPNEEYEKRTLGELVKVCMCKRIKKDQTSDVGDIPFYKNGTVGREADSFISLELYEEYKKKYQYPNEGEVMLSTAGTVGRTVRYDGKPAYFQDSNVVWLRNDEKQITNDYLYWFAMSFPWKLPSRGTIKHLHNDMILDTEISIPPKEVQGDIVNKLNKFFCFYVSDSSALKREIEARKIQFNYYRDKLLEFNRIGEEAN